MKTKLLTIACCALLSTYAQPTLSLLKDINKSLQQLAPGEMLVMGKKMYFQASDSVNGRELWVTDGTEQGTHMVKNICRNGNGSPSQMIGFKGKLYFQAADTLTDFELFVSDGTADGTVLLKEI